VVELGEVVPFEPAPDAESHPLRASWQAATARPGATARPSEFPGGHQPRACDNSR